LLLFQLYNLLLVRKKIDLKLKYIRNSQKKEKIQSIPINQFVKTELNDFLDLPKSKQEELFKQKYS
jgi:hypothetical protein